MKHGHAYTYVLLRYRHDPLAGEVANVGVIVHSAATGFLGAKVRLNIGRLSKMFPDIDRSHLISALKAVERGITKLSTDAMTGLFMSGSNAASIARGVLPDDDSSLIWGQLGSGVSIQPQQTLDKLYARFVGQYDETSRQGRDDAAVWRPVREKLLERNLADRLQPKVIESPLDKVEFEHAWKNGAWHCYQPLSFDLASGESIRDKAARWSGHMTGLSQATDDVRPHFIVGQPSIGALDEDYRRAIDLLRASALNPHVFEESDIDALIDTIQSEISAHDGAAR